MSCDAQYLPFLLAFGFLAVCSAAAADEKDQKEFGFSEYSPHLRRNFQLEHKYGFMALDSYGKNILTITNGGDPQTIFQRKEVKGYSGTLMQSVETCHFLCMNACGNPYITADASTDCFLNLLAYDKPGSEVKIPYKKYSGSTNYVISINDYGFPTRRLFVGNEDLETLTNSYNVLLVKDMTYDLPLACKNLEPEDLVPVLAEHQEEQCSTT